MPPAPQPETAATAASRGVEGLRAGLYEDLERGVVPMRAIDALTGALSGRVRGSRWGLVGLAADREPVELTPGAADPALLGPLQPIRLTHAVVREVRWASAGAVGDGPRDHVLLWGVGAGPLPGAALAAVVDGTTGDPLAAELAMEIVAPAVEVALRLAGQHEAPGARQAERLAGLGGLAGGVAHELNNLLTALIGNLSLARSLTPSGSPSEPCFDALQGSVERASQMAAQMLAFSGRGRFTVRPASVNAAVDEVTPRLQAAMPPRTQLRFGLASSLPPVELDFAQFQQCIVQLVQNAADAVAPRGGTVWVRTLLEEVDVGAVTGPLLLDPLPGGTYVRLEVSDTGPGVPPEVATRMFDPFFSTKGPGRGLGLSAVLGVVRGHGGAIRTWSELGRGTRVEVLLPVVATEPDDRVTQPRPILRGRVLLVDDDGLVRATVGDLLRRLGMVVEEAADGLEAVERFGKDPSGYALVLLDLVMPRMDGPQTWQELKRLRPTVPIVLCTGYDDRRSPTPIPRGGLAGVLCKPFDRVELEAVLRAALKP